MVYIGTNVQPYIYVDAHSGRGSYFRVTGHRRPEVAQRLCTSGWRSKLVCDIEVIRVLDQWPHLQPYTGQAYDSTCFLMRRIDGKGSWIRGDSGGPVVEQPPAVYEAGENVVAVGIISAGRGWTRPCGWNSGLQCYYEAWAGDVASPAYERGLTFDVPAP